MTKYPYKGGQNHAAFDQGTNLFKLQVFETACDGSPKKVWIRNDQPGQHCLSSNFDALYFDDVFNWWRTDIQWEVEFVDVKITATEAATAAQSAWCAFKNLKTGRYLSVDDGKPVLAKARDASCLWILAPGSGAWTAGETAVRVVGGAVAVGAIAGLTVATCGAASAAASATAASTAAATSAEVASVAIGVAAPEIAALGGVATAVGEAGVVTAWGTGALAAAATAGGTAATAAGEAALAVSWATFLAAEAATAATAASTAFGTLVCAGMVGAPLGLGGLATLALGLPTARDPSLWVF